MKKCIVPECFSPIFSHGYCQRHQWRRSDEKYLKSQARQRENRKAKIRGPKVTQYPLKSSECYSGFGFESQIEMFKTLWDNASDKQGNVMCSFTGERLNKFYGTDVWYSCFSHVLPKGKYTYFRLNPENIRIVLPDFHKIIDQGTIKDREGHPEWKWKEWDVLVLRMKLKYIEYKRKNLLS